MDLRQSSEWGKFLETLGWESAYAGEIAIRVRHLGPVSTIKIQRPKNLTDEVLKQIVAVSKKNRAFLTKLEPVSLTSDQQKLLKKYRFNLDNWPLSVSKTIAIDLTSSLEEILGRFSKDGRYCLRRVQHNPACRAASWGGSTRIDDTILKNFYELFKQTANRGHFWVPPLKEIEAKINAFGDNAFIVLAYHEDRVVSGALVLVVDQTAYYLHAGSTLEGHKLEAPYLVIWEIIKKAKELGCTKLDLEGIYDERFPTTTKNWQNFTIFKKKFGGEELTFPGAFSRFF